MFITDAEFLGILGRFAEAGFIIAIFLDMIRFLRIVFDSGKIAVFISDFLSSALIIVILMFLSIEWGGGRPRLLFFFSAAFGMLIYFYTVGIVTKMIAKAFNKLFMKLKRRIAYYIYSPIKSFFRLVKQKTNSFFVYLRQKTKNYVKKTDFGLKKHTNMLYNNKIGKLYSNGGEERNVVKAKVRKKA